MYFYELVSTCNMFTLFSLIISSILIIGNDAAKILAVIPAASISHQVPFRPLTQELAKRGHKVTVITPDPVFPKGKAPKNLREIDVHDLGYEYWNKKIYDLATGREGDTFALTNNALDLFATVFEVELASPEVQELIHNKNETFDLIITELCIRPTLIFAHLYKAPVILASSYGSMGIVNQLVGAPTNSLLYLSNYHPSEMTMWQKFKNFYDNYYLIDANIKHEGKENAMLRKYFGEDIPTLSELLENVQLVFLNVHPIWENNRPVPPNVIYMGGIYQNPKKELPKDLKSYLDSSRHGVIYFSLGTNVLPSLLSKEKIQVMLAVFAKLPFEVLWKYDGEDLPYKPKNVRIGKWFPQSDLLRHPKIKLFITQGGLQSTDEAINAKVPLIGIPMLGDQWLNVERYVRHKIGVRLEFEDITEDTFKNAIDTVIGDESYRRNIEKLCAVMKDQPQSPLDRAVFWTEHVLRHGGEHLKTPAFNMHWIQYYELELVLVILVSLLSVVIFAVCILYCIWRYVRKCYVPIKVKNS